MNSLILTVYQDLWIQFRRKGMTLTKNMRRARFYSRRFHLSVQCPRFQHAGELRRQRTLVEANVQPLTRLITLSCNGYTNGQCNILFSNIFISNTDRFANYRVSYVHTYMLRSRVYDMENENIENGELLIGIFILMIVYE